MSPHSDHEQASEQTPLLDEENSISNDHDIDSESEADTAKPTDGANEVVLAEEPDTKNLVLTMSAIWLGVFFAALDTSIVATLTGPISSDFNSFSLLSWLASGYLIANSACQPLSGKLTDIFSRRTGLIFSNFFFGVGTLICGLAPNAPIIIVGRVIAGVGGGGITCIATFVTSDLVPLRRRGLWQGYGNVVFGMGMGLGGVVGGAFADNLSWRWAFLFQVPFIVVATIMIYFFVDIPVNPSTKPALRRIDFLGALTLVMALVLLLLGLNTGGNQLPWSHPSVITSLVLAVVTLAAFCWIESTPRLVPEPVIPVSLIIRSRTVFTSYGVNWFGTMSTFLYLYYIPLYLQSILSLTPTSAGQRVIPIAVATSLGSLLSGLIMRRTGRYYTYHLISLATVILGALLIAVFFTAHTPSWQTFVFVVPLGYGYGAMLTVTLVAMISAVEHKHQAVITAASYAFRSTGSIIGISIAGAVYQNILTAGLRKEYGGEEGTEEVIARLRGSLKAIDSLPEGWDRAVVKAVEMQAFTGVWWAGLVSAAVAGALGVGMREHRLWGRLSRK